MSAYPKITDYLSRCLDGNRLSHAYVFYGSDEISKKETAFWLANKILKNGHLKFHPDLFTIKPESEEEITISLIRQLKKFLSLRPYSAENKVAVIESADNLNIYSQNAILKIFEEAPEYAVIIVILKTLDSALPTLISRGIKIPFWKNRKETEAPDEKLSAMFENLIDKNFKNKYRVLDKLVNLDPIDTFRKWLDFLRKKMVARPTPETAGIVRKSQDIYFRLRETNANPKLAYDELFLNLSRWIP